MSTLFFGTNNAKYDMIFPAPVLDRIRQSCTVVDAPIPSAVDAEFVRRHIGPADVLVTTWGTPQIDADILKAAPDLKLIIHAAGTVKPIVSDAVWDRGIRVTSSAGAIACGVAEYCMAMMIAACKRFFWYSDRIKQGIWDRNESHFGRTFEIYRQNVGIIGASMVGRRLIELLKAYTCTIKLYDPYCSEEDAKTLGVEKVGTLDELFSTCRVVSLNAPTTEETKGMIRGSHFAQLPDGAVFINSARGIIIRQDEMVAELRKGRFVACLDVTDPEPPLVDDPLRTLPNVIMTPHIAGSVNENLRRIGEMVAANVEAFLSGKPLQGEVTAERLATMA